MSHAAGKARFPDGTIYHFEFDGTVDVVLTSLKKTREEVDRDWRSDTGANRAECTCGRPSEPVELFANYGSGYFWPGTACRHCMAVTDGISVYDIDTDDGVPEWARGPETADIDSTPNDHD